MPLSLHLAELFAIGCFFYVMRRLGLHRGAPLPPGPKGLPVVGNIYDMPTDHIWAAFAQWGEKWGDIIHVRNLGQSTIIINSAKAAVDMMDRKSSIYSDRPHLTMAGELAGWQMGGGFLHYGERHRETRRLLHNVIGTRARAEQFVPVMETEARRFLKRMIADPKKLEYYIRKQASAIILQIAYGYSVNEDQDPLVDLIDEAMAQFSEMTIPNAFLVDVLPFLRYVPKWFPGAHFKRLAEKYAQTSSDMVHVPVAYVKERMAAGTAVPSFTSNLLEDEDTSGEKESIIVWAAASLYAGGSDTTVSFLYTFFLAMTVFPDVQKQAQAEIDAIIGPNRLPTTADRDRLPYTNALVKEVFRFHPVAPLGVAHRLMEDDLYDGYHIPKGSVVIANIWKFLHDPNVYANPMQFNPERFLPSENEPPEQDPLEYCFGFGRRACPGFLLADASAFISCSTSLAALNISKVVQADGTIIEPVVDFFDGTVSHAKSFDCDIQPRSSRVRDIVLSME